MEIKGNDMCSIAGRPSRKLRSLALEFLERYCWKENQTLHKMWALLFLRDRKSCHETLEEEIRHELCVVVPLLTESMGIGQEEISDTVDFLL